MRIKMVIFAILVLFFCNITTRAEVVTINGVTKAILTRIVTEGGKDYLQYRTPEEDLHIAEIDLNTQIVAYNDKLITNQDLKELIEDSQYSAWVWSYNNKISKMMIAKNVYSIRIKAIDPALKRLLSVDGRWYNVSCDVALNHLIAGELVNVYLSFDGSLERILPAEPMAL
ncbi:MAG: hypothetical protein PHD88_02525 [Firmicutes bacterium]|nr:hypothetical protein [Bacillota bacterium]MDD4263028.1 hypothetical protein [Bacillota bacterium]MDD4693267.1 hypothetical protein [Bacillota bacterium]